MFKNNKSIHRKIILGLFVTLIFNLICLIVWGVGYLKPSIQKVYDDSLKLKNQLCFPIYLCSKEIIRKYTPLLNEIDLTYTQYIVMMVKILQL